MSRSVLIATGDLGPNRKDPDSIFNGVRETLKEADLRFGQLEPCLAHTGTPLPQSRLPMRGNPAGAGAIRRAGYDVVSFATNHCMDWGREAFFETISVMEDTGIRILGAGKNIDDARKPVIAKCGDVTIGFLGYNTILPQNYFATKDRPGCAPMRALTNYEMIEHDQPGTPCRIHTWPLQEDLEGMINDIKAIRDKVDIVACSFHWGIHFVPAVLAQYQRIVAHAAIDAGADIILGHHTHILKPIEVYKGKVIIYSMANFALEPPHLFAENLDLHNQAQHKEIQALNKDWKANPGKPMPPDSYKTILVKVYFEDKKIEKVNFIPIHIDDDSNPFTLTSKDEEFNVILDYIKYIDEDQDIHTDYAVEGDEVRVVIPE